VRLTRLEENDPIVAFFPTDHDYVDEGRFAQAVLSAIDVAREHRGRLVLLGAEAENAEVEYGWIEPGSRLIGEYSGESLFRVNRFWEKPSARIARGLLGKGSFWNTFVVVGRARTFLDVLASTVPVMSRAFDPLRDNQHPRSELECATRVYQALPAGDFSRQVLSVCTERLAVLRLGKAGWSDLGTPERVRVAAELKARAWRNAVGVDSGARPDGDAGGMRSEAGVTPAFEAWLEAPRRRLPKIF
jgi:mannose-1-phosphate guanylyltransferase